MSHAIKQKVHLGRSEAVERLHGLADQISSGTLRLGEKELQVPDELRFEIKAEEDELDIGLVWKPAPVLAGAP